MIEMKGEEVDKPASESNIENNNSTSPMDGINEVNIQNNPDIDKEDTSLLSIKQESASICCDGDEEQRSQEGRDAAEAAQMSPVETATLFLLSRIALFNKVMCLQNSTSFCIVFHPRSSSSSLKLCYAEYQYGFHLHRNPVFIPPVTTTCLQCLPTETVM